MSPSRGEAVIAEKLRALEPGSPRHAALAAALSFKASWVQLGEQLASVRQAQLFSSWGFESFDDYCKDEIRITRETAAKLIRSYGFLHETRPALTAPADDEAPPRVPDYRAVDLLARMRDNARVPEPLYRELSEATFDEDLGVSQLRQRLKAEVPDAFARRVAKADPRQQLRAAMSQCSRLIEALAQVDGLDDTVLEQAEMLREMIAGRLQEL